MRTWEDNKSAINQLWPQCQWTDEERRLWKDDLSSLDQAVLYDAVRNVKRTKDTLYPQLKWVLEEHRDLMRARKRSAVKPASHEVKLELNIRDEEDRQLHDDFLQFVDMSSPSDFADVESRVLDNLPKMHSLTAIRVLKYARMRLLGETNGGNAL
jgi:hypothetical protein